MVAIDRAVERIGIALVWGPLCETGRDEEYEDEKENEDENEGLWRGKKLTLKRLLLEVPNRIDLG